MKKQIILHSVSALFASAVIAADVNVSELSTTYTFPTTSTNLIFDTTKSLDSVTFSASGNNNNIKVATGSEGTITKVITTTTRPQVSIGDTSGNYNGHLNLRFPDQNSASNITYPLMLNVYSGVVDVHSVVNALGESNIYVKGNATVNIKPLNGESLYGLWGVNDISVSQGRFNAGQAMIYHGLNISNGGTFYANGLRLMCEHSRTLNESTIDGNLYLNGSGWGGNQTNYTNPTTGKAYLERQTALRIGNEQGLKGGKTAEDGAIWNRSQKYTFGSNANLVQWNSDYKNAFQATVIVEQGAKLQMKGNLYLEEAAVLRLNASNAFSKITSVTTKAGDSTTPDVVTVDSRGQKAVDVYINQMYYRNGVGGYSDVIMEVNADNDFGTFYFDANTNLTLAVAEGKTLSIAGFEQMTNPNNIDTAFSINIVSGTMSDTLVLANGEYNGVWENNKSFKIYDITCFDNENITWKLNDVEIEFGKDFVLSAVDGEAGAYWINQVPEPAEWATIFGAIALGFVVYRRRK